MEKLSAIMSFMLYASTIFMIFRIYFDKEEESEQ